MRANGIGLALRIVAVVALCAAGWSIVAGPGRPAGSVDAAARPIYWTSEKLEPDTIASAWLLARFAAPGCEIRLLPRGERSEVGTPFDLPLVDLARDRTRSTYHVIRAHHRLEDARLRSIGELVDEVEIASWKAVPSHVAAAFEDRLRACMSSAATPEAALEAGFRVLDEMYARARP